MADSRNRNSTSTRPSITIPPPRPPSDALPAPSPSSMTIVSHFFAENFPDLGADFRVSFSQLLAGAMASPSALAGAGTASLLGGDGSSFPDCMAAAKAGSGSGLGFKQNIPVDFTVPVQASASPLFPMSPDFSSSTFFNSPAVGF